VGRHLDPVFHSTAEQYSTIAATQNANYDLVSSMDRLKQKEIEKMSSGSISNIAGFTSLGGHSGLRRPQKTFKPNSWDFDLGYGHLHFPSAQPMMTSSFHQPGNDNRFLICSNNNNINKYTTNTSTRCPGILTALSCLCPISRRKLRPLLERLPIILRLEARLPQACKRAATRTQFLWKAPAD
jgi:hypothetical protein